MLAPLADLPHVGDVRQKGLMVGIELVADKTTKKSFNPKRRLGAEACAKVRRHGVIIRPLGNVIVLMPPYCTTPDQARTMVAALRDAIGEVLGSY